MGCATSAPLVAEASNGGAHEEGEASSSAAISTRGGGKSVDRAVAESSRRSLRHTLSGRFRDYLYDAHGKKVSIDSLKGAPVGIFFTAQTVPQGRSFQKLLLEVHNELRASGRPFEVVLVLNDQTEELWKAAVADTPWVAVPFNDNNTVDKIGTKFEVGELPTLILLDREGKLVTTQGIDVIKRFGASAWPYSAESIKAAEGAKAGHDRGNQGTAVVEQSP